MNRGETALVAKWPAEEAGRIGHLKQCTLHEILDLKENQMSQADLF